MAVPGRSVTLPSRAWEGGVPIEHRYDASIRTVFVDATGEITETEILDLARKLSSDPTIPPGRRELFDLSHAHETAVSSAALRQVGRVLGPTHPPRAAQQ